MPADLPTCIESVDDATAKVLRNFSPGQRIQLAADANDTARIMAAGGIRYAFPAWSEAQVQEEVARRMLNATD